MCFHVLTKWLFTIKHEPKGTPIKYKACLVACRFEQQEGIDYEEVFASVIGWTIIHAVIVGAIQHDWPFTHMDVHF